MLTITHAFLAIVSLLLESKEAAGLCNSVPTQITCEFMSFVSSAVISRLPHVRNVNSISIRSSPGLEIGPHAFESAVKLQSLVINSKIGKLYDDSLQNLNLVHLSMSSCDVDVFPPNMFTGLKFIKILRLDANKLERVPAGLANLPLKELKLSNNNIQVVDKELENLPSLSQLALDGNKLQWIYPHRILTSPQQLGLLFVHNNLLTTITNYMLQGLANLLFLNVGGNSISFVEPNCFEQTPHLNYLVLSNNHIKQMSENVLPRTGMPYLKALYLDDNKLMYLSKSFFVRLEALKEISLVGNPWICACQVELERLLQTNNVTEICTEDYSTGKRPICISDSDEGSECSFVYKEELSMKFETYRSSDHLAKPPLSCVKLK